MKKRPVKKYRSGGAIRGPGTATSDSILARLSNGEYVLPKPAVDMVGLENLEAIRRAALGEVPKYAAGGPVSSLVDALVQKALQSKVTADQVKQRAIGSAIDAVAGVGPGFGGFISGMTHSDNAMASPTNSTGTREYQAAQDAIRQGQGDQATPGIFGLKGFFAGPTPNETAKRLEQQQAVYDEQYRQMTGLPSPTEQRMLRDMNQVNPKAYAGLPRYAMGGSVGGWEQLFGATPPPRGTLADMANRYPADLALEQNRDIGLGAIMPLATLMRPTVDAAKTLYSWLPDSSMTQASKFRENQMQQLAGNEPQPLIRNALSPLPQPSRPQTVRPSNLPGTDAEFYQRLDRGQGPAPQQTAWNGDVPETATLRSSTPSIPPVPGQTANLGAAQYPSTDTISNLGDVAAAKELAALGNRAKAFGPAIDYANQTGKQLLTNSAEGMNISNPVVAGSSRNVGLAGDSGGRRSPLYQTDYAVFGPAGQQGNFSAAGPTQRVGGGTLSQPDQGNGGTVEGNVAALNRQTDALRSWRESMNPGITQSSSESYGGGLPAPPTINPFEMEGDNRLDTAARQQTIESQIARALNPREKMTSHQRQAVLNAANMFLDRGASQQKIAADQQNAATQRDAALRNALLDYTQKQQGTDWEKQKFDATTAEERQKQGLASSQANRDFDLRQQQAINQAQLQAVQTGKGLMDLQSQIDLGNLFKAWQSEADPKKRAQLQQAIELRRRGAINPQELLLQQMGEGR